MFDHLQIYAPRERLMVGVADLLLGPLGWRHRQRSTSPPERVLLLRVERIGDLLMVMDAIAAARAAWPTAQIDLAVGSWNVPIAALIPGINNIDQIDVPWLAREGTGLSLSGMLAQGNVWRARRYDLVVNFEPDIRTNVLAWRTGAPLRAGYWTGGGGALLTDALAYDPESHVSDNALALIRHCAGGDARAHPSSPRFVPGADAVAAANALLADVPSDARLVGLHVSGGRESKQWHLARFAEVGRALTSEPGTTLVLTGGRGDRAMVDQVRRRLGDRPVIDAAGGLDLPATAAVLARLDVLITGDTGPMHLAAAVGTPIVALFGPSDPRRYGPLAAQQRVLRVQLYCSPCGQVRLPPERCRGHVPDCMDGITVEAVVRAAREILAEPRVRLSPAEPAH
ncbi:MAG: glycosyltransferase family 9 protein [Vicinamibacterales bacterium]